MKPVLKRDPYQYWRNLPHFTKADRVHFVTFNTWAQWQLPGECRDVVMSAFHFHNRNKYDLIAVVVMPEHVHALLIPDRDETGYPLSVSEIMHAIKSYTANQIHKLCPKQRRIWQDESMDHVVRHEESLHQKIEYIRMNPVRRGLVKWAEQYRWLWIKQFDS